MTKAPTHLPLALALALLAGCSASSDTGAAQLAVFLPHADAASIARVSVTASAADVPSVSVDLAPTPGGRGGRLVHLPPGAHRTFLAQAFDASGALLFQGSASGVSISAGQSPLIAMSLQELHPGASSPTEPPVIDSLVASSTFVRVGDSLSLTVTAHGLHPGEPLSYAWSSTSGTFSSGTFSSASAATTAWTASDTTGTQTLTLTVTDAGGLSASASLDITVLSSTEGAAQFSISFNSAPRVEAVQATPAQMAVGQTTSVTASASDPDGNSLSYAWSASCAGAWTDATSSAARFTPDALPAGDCNNCELTVTVSDGRGRQTTGTLALCVRTPPATGHFPPAIIRTYTSFPHWEAVKPGQVLTYEVVASDPEGSALVFSWSANTGVLGAPANTGSHSRTTWTAPACAGEGTIPTLTATVTNAFGRTATQRFEAMGLPTCILSEWVKTTGDMSSLRRDHTATLLLNDQVLVVGGLNEKAALATADVYTPSSDTWRTTPTNMSVARNLHTATLLKDGKVLVAGGLGVNGALAAAELYNPAGSGSWSKTGNTLRAARYLHTATRLKDDRVLIAGGYNITDSYLRKAELYNPAGSGSFGLTGEMTAQRGYHTATLLLNGKVLVAGGRDTFNILLTSELYDPATGIWSRTGDLKGARASHTAVLLPDGQVLVSGGTHQGSSLATAEIYNPDTGLWSPVKSMLSARSSAAAVLLNDGQVLVSGGRPGSSTTTLATAELYNPGSGTWSPAGTMTSPRANHTVTLLPRLNGKVLVTGGARNSTVLPTADVYTP